MFGSSEEWSQSWTGWSFEGTRVLLLCLHAAMAGRGKTDVMPKHSSCMVESPSTVAVPVATKASKFRQVQ